jgi:pyruvate formate lyase activating enzyme
MRIVGLEKNSVVDFPGQLAAVVFSPGCNLDCYYCHNRSIIGQVRPEQLLAEEEVFAFLEKRRGLLDGVVFSGGEPTLQPDLAEVMGQVKKLGFLCKLDTNGTNPAVLRDLISEGLVDYVAMDFKAPFHKYALICGNNSNTFLDNIRESIALLLTEKVAYEFRTTVVPELTEEDVLQMAAAIRGARLYVLQQYRVPEFAQNEKIKRTPHPSAFLRKMVVKVSGLVKKCEHRGV